MRNRNKRNLALLSFMIHLLTLSAPVMAFIFPQTSEMITGAHVSLGNSSCVAMECDLIQINFELPLGTDKPQYVKFVITPECFSNPPTENETYSIQFYCVNGHNETIDLKTAQCDPASSIVRWIELNQTDPVGYYFYENQQYEDLWCAFKRDANNTERLPTEFSVVVDTLGLTNPEEEGVLAIQRSAGVVILNGIREIFMINFNALQILFYVMSGTAVVVGFVVLIGGVPIVLKWIFKKVTK